MIVENLNSIENSKLCFFGNGGAFDFDLYNSQGYIHLDKTLILIDCGEKNIDILIKFLKKHNSIKNIHLLITHTHSDHVNGLSTFQHYIRFVEKECSLLIYSHKKISSDIQTLLKINGNENFQIISLENNQFINIDNLDFTFIDTEHVKNIPSFGILFSFLKKNYYFSGDSKSIPKEILNLLLDDRIDFLYQDIFPYRLTQITKIDETVPHMKEIEFVKYYPKYFYNKKIKIFFYHNSVYNPHKNILDSVNGNKIELIARNKEKYFLDLE